MADIYVTGHKNPDTDSIVAALSYANLKNALGERDYKAVRIGGINDETKRVLDLFGIDPPERVGNMKTQVRDLDFDNPPKLNSSVTLNLAWNTMRQNKIASMPILNDDGTLYGVITAGDIASYDMETISSGYIDNLPVFNLLSVIEGTMVNETACRADTVSGDVVIVLPSAMESNRGKNGIVICGNQSEVIEKAVKNKVNCVIMCQAEIDSSWAELESPCIISTPLDAKTVARAIYQAMPVSVVCNTEEMVCFHLNDYVEEVKDTLAKTRYRSYPILDENEKVVGTLARYHLLKPRRKKCVLVDHNEASQSVSGLEEAEILEIIDHHRLGDIQTSQPVSVRNEPVGSTNTIITQMYMEKGIVPSPSMAGIMAAAILSDTVMFKSPTCTERDVTMAQRLAKIAKVKLEDIGKELFSASCEDKSAEELFKSDYKQFHISGHDLGIAQITTADSSQFKQRREEFDAVMEKYRKEKELDYVILMITDVLREGTYIYYLGNEDVIAQAFNARVGENPVFMPQVMSRKKQVVPMLTALWG